MSQAVALAVTFDRDATEIGALYLRSRESLTDSVRAAVECGARLQAKKDSLEHGAWLRWLKDNAHALQMNVTSTPQRLMKLHRASLEDSALTQNLTPQTATAISRQVWGNESVPLILQSGSNEWYTPAEYLEAARRVLGTFDLDPASTACANETVQASRYFTAEDDGLQHGWHGRVWLNPPYGGASWDFVAKLVESYREREVTAAVVLLNAFSTHTAGFQPLWNFPLCFTDHRIAFVAGGGQAVSSTTFGSVFAYLGDDTAAFVREFRRFGPVVRQVEAA